MRGTLRKSGIAVATILAIVGTTIALPESADARWGHGGWGHGGWGWGGFGLGLGTGLALGAAPYYGGYYGGYYGPYAYDYGPYAYDYGYGSYAYDGGCYIRRRWVSDGYGHRVLRRVRVCY
jgi:hypothetical protein